MLTKYMANMYFGLMMLDPVINCMQRSLELQRYVVVFPSSARCCSTRRLNARSWQRRGWKRKSTNKDPSLHQDQVKVGCLSYFTVTTGTLWLWQDKGWLSDLTNMSYYDRTCKDGCHMTRTTQDWVTWCLLRDCWVQTWVQILHYVNSNYNIPLPITTSPQKYQFKNINSLLK